MTNNPLDYQPTASNIPTGLRTATWITTLIVGILTAIGGLCFGGAMAFGFALFASLASSSGSGTSSSAGPPTTTLVIIVVMALCFFLFPIGIGITLVMTSFKVRKSSRAAAVIALVLTTLLGFLFAAMALLGGIMGLRNGSDIASAILGAVSYLFVSTVYLTNAFLLFRTLRQQKQQPHLIAAPSIGAPS